MTTPHPTTPMPLPTLGDERPGVVIVFGGTFDPPHFGHVELPLRVCDKLEELHGCKGQGWLVYVPAARSPHKDAEPVASDEQRMQMLQLAVSETPRTAVWTDEIDRACAEGGTHEPSYTVDTLRRAREWLDEHLLSGAAIRLLIGADQAVGFHRWREPRDILRLAKPAVMIRGEARDADALLQKIAASQFWSAEELAMWSGAITPVGTIDVSATQVRAALRSGDDEQMLRFMSPVVLKYIQRMKLYGVK